MKQQSQVLKRKLKTIRILCNRNIIIYTIDDIVIFLETKVFKKKLNGKF